MLFLDFAFRANVKLHCESKSNSKTFLACKRRPQAILCAVVVFPTPPFGLLWILLALISLP